MSVCVLKRTQADPNSKVHHRSILHPSISLHKFLPRRVGRKERRASGRSLVGLRETANFSPLFTQLRNLCYLLIDVSFSPICLFWTILNYIQWLSWYFCCCYSTAHIIMESSFSSSKFNGWVGAISWWWWWCLVLILVLVMLVLVRFQSASAGWYWCWFCCLCYLMEWPASCSHSNGWDRAISWCRLHRAWIIAVDLPAKTYTRCCIYPTPKLIYPTPKPHKSPTKAHIHPFKNRRRQNLGISKVGLTPPPTPQFWHTGGFDDKKCINATRDNPHGDILEKRKATGDQLVAKWPDCQ